MKRSRERQNDPSDPHLTVRLPQPGEGCRPPGGDLLAPPDGYEEVVAQLPDCVGDRRPGQHGEHVGVVGGRAGLGGPDGPDGGKPVLLRGRIEEMHDAVEGGARHDVDE